MRIGFISAGGHAGRPLGEDGIGQAGCLQEGNRQGRGRPRGGEARLAQLNAASIVDLSPEAWNRLKALNTADIDTSTGGGLVEVGQLAGPIDRRTPSDLPCGRSRGSGGDWFSALDFDRIVQELVVQVHLTGRSTFRLGFGTQLRALVTLAQKAERDWTHADLVKAVRWLCERSCKPSFGRPFPNLWPATNRATDTSLC